LSVATAFAHQQAALNGRWTLVPAQSDFAGQPVVQTGSVTIDERNGDITVSRSFKCEAASDTFFYRDITDSENNATIQTGRELKTETRWDHDVLKVTNTNTQSGGYTRNLRACRGWRHDGQRPKAVAQADKPALPTQIDQMAWNDVFHVVGAGYRGRTSKYKRGFG